MRCPCEAGSHGAEMISGTRVDCSELWNFPVVMAVVVRVVDTKPVVGDGKDSGGTRVLNRPGKARCQATAEAVRGAEERPLARTNGAVLKDGPAVVAVEGHERVVGDTARVQLGEKTPDNRVHERNGAVIVESHFLVTRGSERDRGHRSS